MAETIRPEVWEQIRAIPYEERICLNHPDFDPVTHLPVGVPCSRRAVSVVEWTAIVRGSTVTIQRAWSFACEHHGHGHIDKGLAGLDGWTYKVKRLPTQNPTWRATCGGCGWPIGWAWVPGGECRNCVPKLTTGVPA